ncbi:MAG: folylpolyglutamate synthase/dihydrofolate synthase family protein [Phycisphaerales bacterium]
MPSTGNTAKTTKQTATKGKKKRSKAPKKPATTITTYRTAKEWLYGLMDVERTRSSRVDPDVFKLDRMRAMLAKLDNPQDDLNIVHVAGTNGKGSTVAMLDSALRACGLTVGVYTSPHLEDVRERVSIGGSPISQHHFAQHMARVEEASLALPKKLGSPTFFEAITALGFLHFAEQAVDLAIIEVGMGGRLDSTNVVEPLISAVTRVDKDHMQFLGDTLEAIAREKAGIFKSGVPALTLPQAKGVVEAMREVAEGVGTTLEVVDDDIDFSHRFEAGERTGPHVRIGLATERRVFEHVPVPLPGEHQAFNCGLVLAIIDRLGEHGFELPEPAVVEGLAQTVAPGRMELVWREPRILLDGAHNPSAMAALVRTIGSAQPYDSMVMIFGCSADKDVDAMLEEVAKGADKVVFTRARGNPRAADPHELARKFEAMSHKMCQVGDTIDESLKIAAQASGRGDLIVVTGSFYLVGETRKHLSLKARRAAASNEA